MHVLASSISTYDDRVLVPGTTERCCTPPEGAQTLPHGAHGNEGAQNLPHGAQGNEGAQNLPHGAHGSEGAQNLPHGAHGSEGGQEACSYSPKWARRAFLSVPTTRLDKYH